MKILLAVHQFMPEHASGTEVLTYQTARELIDRGHEVRVLTANLSPRPLTDEEQVDSYEYRGVRVERFRFYRGPSPLDGADSYNECEYNNPLTARRFQRLLDRFKPDVVHFFHLMRLSASLIDVCLEQRIPTVFTPTDFWFLCPYAQLLLPGQVPCPGPDRFATNCLVHVTDRPRMSGKVSAPEMLPWAVSRSVLKRTWGSRFDRASPPDRYQYLLDGATALIDRNDFLMKRLNRLDRVLVPTRFMKKTLLEHGLDKKRIEFLPFGLNLDGLKPGARGYREGRLRIGFIGTLSPHKGLHVLIEAVRDFPGDRPLEVHVYGNLDEMPEYVAQQRELAGEDGRIKFHGTFPNHLIGEIFSGLDVLVVPSVWHENTPLVVYSAQACGCPVVASDVPGISEVIVEGENGLLFPAGDAAALAERLRQLDGDRTLLKRLSGNARPPLSIGDYVDRVLDAYPVTSARDNGISPACGAEA